MEVKLKRLNKAFHFEASNEDNLRIDVDSSPNIGGEGKGIRPMELILMGLAGCVSIDIGLILKKQKQNIEDYQVEVIAERKTDDSKAFKSIHLHFILEGEIDNKKFERAVELALNKYCSVSLSLREDINIDYTYVIK